MEKIVEILVKLFAGGSWQSIMLILLLVAVVGSVVVIVVGAFIQGRAITIWPPAIGERPDRSVKGDSGAPKKEGATGANIDRVANQEYGIKEIFPRRDLFQSRYPLPLMASQSSPGSIFRIVGRTLYLLINQPEPLRTVVRNGAALQLCFFDPRVDPGPLKKLAYMEQHDTLAALATFRNSFSEWLVEERPAGTLELRYHNVQLMSN